MSYIDPSVRIVTKLPKVGPLLKFSIFLSQLFGVADPDPNPDPNPDPDPPDPHVLGSVAVADPDPDPPDPHVFWASWIRIRIH
jgi:hypothetical protein